MTSGERVEHRYQVRASVQVYEKYLRKSARKNFRAWVVYAATQVPFIGVFGAVSYVCGIMFSKDGSYGGLIPAFLFAVLISPVWFIVLYENGIQQRVSSIRNKVWDCILTDEYYEFTDNDGVKTLIPWNLMKFEATEPEYWEISCREFRVMIFREPLQKAGLESEFDRRVKQM